MRARALLFGCAIASLAACTVILGVQDLAGLDASVDAGPPSCGPEAGLYDVNLVANPTFDAGLTVWAGTGPGVQLAIVSPGDGNAHACRICVPNNSYAGIEQDISGNYPAHTSFALFANVADASDDATPAASAMNVQLLFFDCDGGQIAGPIMVGHLIGGGWEIAGKTGFVVPAAMSSVRVQLTCVPKAPTCGCLLVDNISLIATPP